MQTQVQMQAQGMEKCICTCVCICVAPVYTYFSVRLRLHFYLRLSRTCEPGSRQMQAQTQHLHLHLRRTCEPGLRPRSDVMLQPCRNKLQLGSAKRGKHLTLIQTSCQSRTKFRMYWIHVTNILEPSRENTVPSKYINIISRRNLSI